MMQTKPLQNLSDVINVEDLMSRCLDNIDFVKRILNVLQSRCAEDIDELEKAVEESDAKKVADLAHRLKGALSNAAAYSLSELADQICCSANNNTLDELQSGVVQLRQGWNKLSDKLVSEEVVTA